MAISLPVCAVRLGVMVGVEETVICGVSVKVGVIATVAVGISAGGCEQPVRKAIKKGQTINQ